MKNIKNIDIRDFAIKIQLELQSILGSDFNVEINENPKLNGVKLWAVTIHEKDVNISPAIYVESFFEDYKSGKAFENIVSDILSIYKDNKPSKTIDISYFESFDMIKDKICFKLCNTIKNTELLENVPSIPYYDLSIVFYVRMYDEVLGNGQILIRNEHMELWNSNVSELMKCALENTPKIQKKCFSNVLDMLKKLSNNKDDGRLYDGLEDGLEDELVGTTSLNDMMWVLTNSDGFNGAAAILYPDVFDYIKNKIKVNYFIIPSSVHELLIVPDTENYCSEDEWKNRCSSFLQMIENVNSTEVPEPDILSDNLYYYNIEDEKMIMITMDDCLSA